MQRVVFVVGILALAACLVQGTTVRGQDNKKFQLSDQEKKLLELTNAERKKAELPPLSPSPLLFRTARAHSANMAKQRKMEHDLDGMNPFQRIKAVGYRYAWAGENIAYGDSVIPMERLMKAWMDSKVHRDNILSDKFTEIGLGVVRNEQDELYYTQVFAKPR